MEDFDIVSHIMKVQESSNSIRFDKNNGPVVARLDGKNFSKLTKIFKSPFSYDFMDYMDNVTRKLIEYSNADVGFTQSDEITLCWLKNPYFDGKQQKINSVLASLASLKMFEELDSYRNSKQLNMYPIFDCRSIQLENSRLVEKNIRWRQSDCTRNAIQTLCRHYYSHNECDKKKINEMLDMIKLKGDNFDYYPKRFKYGLLITRETQRRKLTGAELNELPELHEARKNPDMEFERSVLKYQSTKLRSGFLNDDN